MRILKILLLTVATIIVLGLIAALFIDKDYKVEKEITINKPRQEVFAFLKHLKNQDLFSYWASMDTAMQKTYTGTDGTVGFISAWKGNDKVGQGEQEITGIKENERLDYDLRFKEPMESNASSYITTEEAGAGQTKVKWAIYGKNNYPGNIMNPMMDFMMGKDISTGLSNLKVLMEKR
jgi:uncharacterized protein YndB with AHSA1/START domain